MNCFSGCLGLQLKKYLSIALSVSMVTLTMPLNGSALDNEPSGLPQTVKSDNVGRVLPAEKANGCLVLAAAQSAGIPKKKAKVVETQKKDKSSEKVKAKSKSTDVATQDKDEGKKGGMRTRTKVLIGAGVVATIAVVALAVGSSGGSDGSSGSGGSCAIHNKYTESGMGNCSVYYFHQCCHADGSSCTYYQSTPDGWESKHCDQNDHACISDVADSTGHHCGAW